MGIYIYLNISTAIKAKEWELAYEKSLILVKQLPFMEKIKKEYYGANLICGTKTEEKEYYGRLGWLTVGDSYSMNTAEEYFLPKNILERINTDLSKEKYVDSYMSILPAYSNFSFEDQRCNRVIGLWGNKTQAEPYHFYLLAVACMLEHELPGKVAVYGDITRGQYKKAAQIASTILKEEIKLPDRCDMQKLFQRVKKMPLQDKEMVNAFSTLYLGNQDKEFGAFIRNNFSEKELQFFWEDIFNYSKIGTYGFSDWLKKYLLWGFSISNIKNYISFQLEEGSNQASKFVEAVLDTEIFLNEKDCEDVLEIDKEEEGSYSVSTLMAQFLFAGAKNHRVDRYIPLEELITELVECVNGSCDVSQIIANYMEEREKKNDEISSTDLLNTYMHGMRKKLMTSRKEYDITDPEQLMLFKNGNTIDETLNKSLLNSFAVYRKALEETYYEELLHKDFPEAIRFLIEQNRYILLMEESWKKIFHDIEENIATLERYYPMIRMKITKNEQHQIIQALVLNDEFYQYCIEQLDRDPVRIETEWRR